METFQLNQLNVAQFTCTLRSAEPATLPPYLGSMLRGALGHALKDVGCPARCADPSHCQEACAYAYCFETPMPTHSTRMRNIDTAPHPFVLKVPSDRLQTHRPTQVIEFSMLLFGKGIEYFPYFCFAIEQMAEQGLSERRIPFVLEEIRDTLHDPVGRVVWNPKRRIVLPLATSNAETLLTPQLPSPLPQHITIQLHTPLRIVEKKQLLRRPSFRSFTRSLLGRLSSLLYFHCQSELDVDFRHLLDQADQVQCLEDSFEEYELWRKSNRQRNHVPLHGVMGKVLWHGAAISTLWPLLAAGQYFHAGKSTGMGLGEYSILTPR